MAAVQDGNGKQIQDSQIDAQNGDQEHDTGNALRCRFPGYIGDGQGTADVLAGNITDNHLVDAHCCQFRPGRLRCP